MWSVLVVPAEVAGEREGAVSACRVAEAVGLFAEERFDERFGLSVGLWAPWPGVASRDPEIGAGGCPFAGAIAVAVVRG